MAGSPSATATALIFAHPARLSSNHLRLASDGIDGLREVWLDWLSPWETYRTEIEEARDLGDRVLLLVHDFGRRTGSTQEVALNGASVWTVRDGTIVRAEFHSDRTTALEAVGRGGRRCRRRTWKSLADLSQQSTPAKA
jgi:hypothetical protein